MIFFLDSKGHLKPHCLCIFFQIFNSSNYMYHKTCIYDAISTLTCYIHEQTLPILGFTGLDFEFRSDVHEYISECSLYVLWDLLLYHSSSQFLSSSGANFVCNTPFG